MTCSCPPDRCDHYAQAGCAMMIREPFDFIEPQPGRPRRVSYHETLAMFLRGTLSLGLLWELAERDEVFRAWLIKRDVERP